MSRLWINAADLAIKNDRNDLLIGEIGPMVRSECKNIKVEIVLKLQNQKTPNFKGKQQKISKKAEKRRGRGENGRDVWGLQNESAMCEELWNYAQISSLVESTIQVSDVLLLLATTQDFDLISQLQAAVESYTNVLMTNAPPIAPDYPPEWLENRLMKHVKFFQDKRPCNNDMDIENQFDDKQNRNSNSDDYNKIQTWWETAADGIKYWRTIKKITFSRL